jgi:hypothetical protein
MYYSMTSERINDIKQNYDQYTQQDRNILVDITYPNSLEKSYFEKQGWTVN